MLFLLLCGCATSQLFNSSLAPNQGADLQALSGESHLWQGNPIIIWKKIQPSSLNKLQSALVQSSDPLVIGWLKLALISKRASTDSQELVKQLMLWRKEYPTHAANALIPDDSTLIALQNAPMPTNIALLLPLNGPLSTQGQMIRDGFLNAYYEATKKNQQTVSFIDTSKTVNMTALYQQAIAQGADALIGPLSKEHVIALLKQQNTFPIPTIALNYTGVSLGSLPAHFYEYGLSIQDEAQQMADKAWQMGKSRAIIIALQNDWGQRVTQPLIARWQSLGGVVTETFYYTPTSNLSQSIANLLHIDTKSDREKMQENNNKQALEQQRRQDFDVLFLVAQPQMARQIVPLLKYYYIDKIPILASSAIYTGSPDPQKDSDLNGVYFCDIPWILRPHHKMNSEGSRLYAVGMDSYLISNNISRLNQLPYFPIYGATGALSLTSKHQIYRRLPWMQMHDGHP
jgi:outer membrane PBP1 activator LpoA protein